MIFIAHRGRRKDAWSEEENSPYVIDACIDDNIEVEVDLWYKHGQYWLGHDAPQYHVEEKDWLRIRSDYLWIHCKNADALRMMASFGDRYKYFWHDKDDYTITSRGYIWAYPGKRELVHRTIHVLPERNLLPRQIVSFYKTLEAHDKLPFAICTDYVYEFKRLLGK